MINRCVTAALAIVLGITAVEAAAQSPPQGSGPKVSSALPASIMRAAVATRSDESGQIAGTRIANSNHFIVYIRTLRGCGSGGCRAQIWNVEGIRAVRKKSIAVGRLPIVLLPQVDNSMPRIGVTVVSENKLAILPIAFDGENYTGDQYEGLMPPSSGTQILTSAMLRPF